MKLHVLAERVLWALLVVLAQGCTVLPVAPEPMADLWDGGAADASRAPGMQAGAEASVPVPALADASICQPGDVRTFQPGDYHPAASAWQGACAVSGRIDRFQQFYDACLGPNASVNACENFRKVHTACADCIVTADTATRYGPLIRHNDFIAPNLAGCLELTLPGALTCAKSVQALASCELAACEANCHVTDPQSLAAFGSCAEVADNTGCAPYVGAAACADSADASPEAARCLIADFEHFYREVAPLFCGVAPADAGSVDPTLDASSE